MCVKCLANGELSLERKGVTLAVHGSHPVATDKGKLALFNGIAGRFRFLLSKKTQAPLIDAARHFSLPMVVENWVSIARQAI